MSNKRNDSAEAASESIKKSIETLEDYKKMEEYCVAVRGLGVETPETSSTELFSTPKDFLKILKAPNHNFYYTQRKGIDSVSIVLVHDETLEIGLTRESKPPFSEREGVPLAFKLTALGGSLFDMVDTQEYLKMPEEGRVKIVQLTAQKEVLEEAGYDVPLENVKVGKKVVFNSMSNEYVYLCVVLVNDSHKVPPIPQNHLESLASIEWLSEEELETIECGKTLATLSAMALTGLGAQDD